MYATALPTSSDFGSQNVLAAAFYKGAANASGNSGNFTGSLSLALDLSKIAPAAELSLHFLNPNGSSTAGSFSLSLNIMSSAAGGGTTVTETFTSASSAADWFNSHTINFGQAGSLGTPGNESFNLQLALGLTASNPSDFFQVEAVLADGPLTIVPEPSVISAMVLGGALLVLIRFRSQLRRKLISAKQHSVA
jgi:hypothetical protein